MRVLLYITICVALPLIYSCETNIENKAENKTSHLLSITDTLVKTPDTLQTEKKTQPPVNKPIKEDRVSRDSLSLEDYLIRFGLVNLQTIIPQILVDLKYSTTDNFVGIDMYGELGNAYCQPDVAQKLKKAYEFLQEEDSTLTLLVFDAVRPVFVQQKMWDTLVMPIREKTKFLSNPKNHSIHNYGAAIDISLSTKEGKELDMGTPFDYIGVLAHPRQEQKLLKQKRITQKQIENRILLRKVMKKAGFFNIQTEWWHFNSCTRSTAKRKYQVVR